MNKLNNQRCSLHSILLSLSILLTLLFIAIGAAADGDVAAGSRESGNLTKPVRSNHYCLSFLFFFIFGPKNFRFEKI